MLSDTKFVVIIHVLQHHGLSQHTSSPHGELSISRVRNDAAEGRTRLTSWLPDFCERLAGLRGAHFNGLDAGHGAPRRGKMPSATSSCSRRRPAKIIAGINGGGSVTVWAARGARRGHGSHAAAAARRERISISTAFFGRDFTAKRNDPTPVRPAVTVRGLRAPS